MRGISAEFTEYRPYRQGDDLGRIDWKLFARSDRAYIRLSNDRAIFPTMIVLDASASMDFPVGRTEPKSAGFPLMAVRRPLRSFSG